MAATYEKLVEALETIKDVFEPLPELVGDFTREEAMHVGSAVTEAYRIAEEALKEVRNG